MKRTTVVSRPGIVELGMVDAWTPALVRPYVWTPGGVATPLITPAEARAFASLLLQAADSAEWSGGDLPRARCRACAQVRLAPAGATAKKDAAPAGTPPPSAKAEGE